MQPQLGNIILASWIFEIRMVWVLHPEELLVLCRLILRGISPVQINLSRLKVVSNWSSDLERWSESAVVDRFPFCNQQQIGVYSMFPSPSVASMMAISVWILLSYPCLCDSDGQKYQNRQQHNKHWHFQFEKCLWKVCQKVGPIKIRHVCNCKLWFPIFFFLNNKGRRWSRKYKHLFLSQSHLIVHWKSFLHEEILWTKALNHQ